MEKCKFDKCAEKVFKNSFCKKHYEEILTTIRVDEDLDDRSSKSSRVGPKKVTPAEYFQTVFYRFGRMFGSVINGYQKIFDVTVEDASFILEKRAKSLLEQKDYEKACAMFSKIIQYKPNDPEVIYNLGYSYLKRGSFSKAGRCFEKVIKLDSKNIKASFHLGISYSREEKFQKAIDTFKQIIKFDKGHVGAHYRCGLALDNLKNHDEAITFYKKTIELNPNIAKVYQSLGFSLESKGQHTEAVKYFKKAIDLEGE